MKLPPNLPVQIGNSVPANDQHEPILPPKNRFFKGKLFLPVFGIFIFLLITLGVAFSKNIFAFLGRLGVYNLLRSVGLIQPNIPGYFAALQDQNPIYDLNKDGTVSGDDYALLISDMEDETTSVSAYDVADADDPAAGETAALPSVRAFSTDAFSGSSTVSYPITLPAGTGGMTPSLSISYSSASVDDLYVGTETIWRNDPYHSYQKQAGILGLGWNLGSLGSISRDHRGTFNNPDDDTFVLSFSGGSASLTKESGDNSYSLWRTVPNLKLKIERWGRCKVHYFDGGSWNICRYHWQVTDGLGTKYYFGSPSTVANWKRPNDPDASYFAEGTGNDWYPLYDETADGPIGSREFTVFGSTRQGLHALTTTWLLTKVESVFDINGTREVEVNYANLFEFGIYRDKRYVSASYPKKITWGNNEVSFVLEPRLDYKTHQGANTVALQPLKSLNRLKKIVVKTLGKVTRAYTFDYVYGWDPTKHADDGDGIAESDSEVISGQAIHSLLTSITPWSDDPSVNAAAKKLPLYKFSYGANCAPFTGGCPLTAFVNEDTYTQQKTPNDFFLSVADNGLKGKVTFEYWSNATGGNAMDVRQCDGDKLGYTGTSNYYCKTNHEENIGRHRVSAKIVNDGMGSNIKSEYRYTGSGESQGLAYVKSYDENYVIDDCPCQTGDELNCVGNGVCSEACDWEQVARALCPSGYTEYLCTGTTIECGANEGKFNRVGVCTCSDDHIDIPLTGFEFLGYPEVETLVYEKNSTKVVARSKSYYHQAVETANCFKPNPLKGVAYKIQNFNADNAASWTETESKYTVRFGPMFGTYTEKVDSDLASYCTGYDPDTTVSLVMATDSVSKSLMPSPQLCTKQTTSYANADGSVDHYANPHKVTNYGKVSCADTSQDDSADTKWETWSEYTSANTTKWLTPLPKETWSTLDGIAKFKHSRMYYDSQLWGTLGNYGQLTKSETLIDNVSYASSTIEYNSAYPWLVWKTTDPNGKTTTTDYDAIHHLYPVKVTNHLGHAITTEYDFNSADSSHPNYGDVLGLPIKITDANNAKTTTVYDDFGRQVEVYLPGKQPGVGIKPNQFSKYYYFNESDISPCTEANNCLIGLGTQISSPTGPIGPKMMLYHGTRFSDSGGAGKVSAIHTYYNGLGQDVQTRQLWYENEWTSAGIPVDGEGLKDIFTNKQYNSLGNITYQTLPVTTSPYVPGTNNSYVVVNTLETPVSVTAYTYDGFGRTSKITYPDFTSEESVYDLDGNPLKTKSLDKNCKDSDTSTPCAEKIVTLNAFGQVVENKQVDQYGIANTTSTQTHPILGILSITDTRGNIVSKVEYDSLGRKSKMWDIDMSPAMSGDTASWRYTYDKLGNLRTQTDPKNRVTELIYDDLYRIKTQKVAGTTLLDNTYDCYTNGKGRLCFTRSYNPEGGAQLQNKSFEYDPRGRLIKETVSLSNMPDSVVNLPSDQVSGQFGTSYAYDEGGRILATEYWQNLDLGIPAETVSYSYDRNRALGLTSSIGSQRYAYYARYNKNSQILGFNSGNNVTNTFNYNGGNLRLTSLNVDGSALTADQKLMLSYTYDPLGNIRNITDNNTAKTPGTQFYLTQNFTYDTLQRLKSAGGAYTANYSYDDIGNITLKQEGLDNITLNYNPYSASTLSYYHRPSSVTVNGTSEVLVYDEVGNLLQDNKNTYTYDPNNRLVSVTGSTVLISADANADGVVNDADYTIWLSHFDQSTLNGISDGDFNTDGLVNGIDYAIWRDQYGQTQPSPTPSSSCAVSGPCDAFLPCCYGCNTSTNTCWSEPQPTRTTEPTSTPTPTPVLVSTATPTPTPSPVLSTCASIDGICRNRCLRYETTVTGYSCTPSTYRCCVSGFVQ